MTKYENIGKYDFQLWIYNAPYGKYWNKTDHVVRIESTGGYNAIRKAGEEQLVHDGQIVLAIPVGENANDCVAVHGIVHITPKYETTVETPDV